MIQAPAIIKTKSFWNLPINRLKAVVSPGRPRTGRTTAGSWIADLVELKKCINLCKACQPKFNVAGAGYFKFRELGGEDHCVSRCDDCRLATDCNTYMSRNVKRG